MDASLLLATAVTARIAAWDHPSMEERGLAAEEVGLMLQEVVRCHMPDAIPHRASLDGLKELSADLEGATRVHLVGAFYLLRGNDDSMLPMEASLDVSPQADSSVRVGGEASVFPMPTSERQFVRAMENVQWAHSLTLHLA